MRLRIDPGFVNYRRVQTIIPKGAMEAVNRAVSEIPPEVPEHLREFQIDHHYAQVVVDFCEVNGIPTLSQLLAKGKGRLFCSTEIVDPCPEVWTKERVRSRIRANGDFDEEVWLEYGVKHLRADTTKGQLANGSEVAIVAQFDRSDGNVLTFAPIVIGAPWLEEVGGNVFGPGAEWWSHSFGEIFIEDIEEFAKTRDVDPPQNFEVMEQVKEKAFKQCLAEVLAETAPKDWGGEQSDLYTSHLHLDGKRMTGAFLLKGRAQFRPMGLNQLGKNNDQIVRLSKEPADVFIVQHCHDILPAVRDTLRAFTISLGPVTKRYCLIDGRDSLRILLAYDKLDRALELSREVDGDSES